MDLRHIARLEELERAAYIQGDTATAALLAERIDNATDLAQVREEAWESGHRAGYEEGERDGYEAGRDDERDRQRAPFFRPGGH
jgi:flagellar biosynthesis/type III secretory pathway protein FliH